MEPFISALTLYPIKGCQGIILTEAFALNEGLAVKLANGEMLHDRQFMVVDSQGQFITQREVPLMATIGVSIAAEGLSLSALGHESLHVPIGSKLHKARKARKARNARNVVVWNFAGSGLDVGLSATAWFTKVLQRPAALVQFDSSVPRNCKEIGSIGSKTYFADSFGYLLISQASVTDLEQRMREHHQDASLALSANRFRANILLDGIAAYEEDHVRTFDFEGAVLEVVSKCVRCNVPGVDQSSGEVQLAQPTAVLDTYRLDLELGGSTIGVNAIRLQPVNQSDGYSIVKTGQKIAIEYAF
jgi:uncharacterized protein